MAPVHVSLLLGLAVASLGACANDSAESPTPPVTPTPTSTTTPTTDCSGLSTGITNTTLTAGGATHDVRIYVPPVPTGTGVLPVVLNWHANGANGEQQAGYTEYEALAEQEGFIVVHPTGTRLDGVPVLEQGTGWELVDGLESPAVDDLAFANALIDELIANWCADASYIFSIGMSNGGLFTSAMVCELADRLAGAGSVAGLYHPESCEPSRAVPYIAFAGITDPVVPFETAGETVYPELRENVLALGSFDAFAAFATQFGCDAEPTVTEFSQDVTRYDYLNCEDGVPMTLYAFEANNGHSWPGAPSDQSTTDEIDATLESWHFFESIVTRP